MGQFTIFTETVNATCLHPSPPPLALFPIFLLDITVVPREIEDNGYAKFWRVKKVHYGLNEGKWSIWPNNISF